MTVVNKRVRHWSGLVREPANLCENDEAVSARLEEQLRFDDRRRGRDALGVRPRCAFFIELLGAARHAALDLPQLRDPALNGRDTARTRQFEIALASWLR